MCNYYMICMPLLPSILAWFPLLSTSHVCVRNVMSWRSVCGLWMAAFRSKRLKAKLSSHDEVGVPPALLPKRELTYNLSQLRCLLDAFLTLVLDCACVWLKVTRCIRHWPLPWYSSTCNYSCIAVAVSGVVAVSRLGQVAGGWWCSREKNVQNPSSM